MQFVGPSCKFPQLSASGSAVGRLGEPLGVERQNLVGAEHETSGT